MSGRVKKHQIIVFCFLFLLWLCFFSTCVHSVNVCLLCIGRRCNLSLGAVKLNGPCTDLYKRNLGIFLHFLQL